MSHISSDYLENICQFYESSHIIDAKMLHTPPPKELY